ncbi:MAG: hypothetical protein ACXAC6_04460 [Candidatus Hodarchaeales archaeon]|jgi:hypothetical protein
MLGSTRPYGIGAYHNSTVPYGTWSFDWIAPTEIGESAEVVVFIIGNPPIHLNGTSIDPPTLNAYLIVLESISGSLEDDGFYITFGEYNYGIWHIIEEYSSPDPFTGLIHIDITRDKDGTFRVYTDSSLKPVIELVNNRYKISERICFWAWDGESAVDNVVVYDSVELIPETSSTTTFTIEVLLFVLPLTIFYSRKRRR